MQDSLGELLPGPIELSSQRHICMLKGVLFSLYTSSLSPISGYTIMSP